ncbi:uncharacterized protein [Watersipora subatra]|uniref:uncharacterized protein isoform X2 n=1 Tax=Watersipora subatra TaxID=2589382 RepID=UPI00355B3FEF
MLLKISMEAKELLVLLAYLFGSLIPGANSVTIGYHPYFDIDPNYQGGWKREHNCWLPSDVHIDIYDCSRDTNATNYSFGCCLQKNGSYVTCALEEQVCPDNTTFISGNHTIDAPSMPYACPNCSNTVQSTSTFSWMLQTIKPHGKRRSLNSVLTIIIILVSIVIVGGAIICCCRYATCSCARPKDDLTSVSTPNRFYAPLPLIVHKKASADESVCLDVECLQASLPPYSPRASQPAFPFAPPAYEEVGSGALSFPWHDQQTLQHI